MKKITLISLLLFVVMTCNARLKGFVCTVNNVNVRIGAGKSYLFFDAGNGGKKHQLFKGDVVQYSSKRKNGFILIQGPLEWGGDFRDGWVSDQYMCPVV